MTSQELYEQVIALNIPHAHYASDLYIKITVDSMNLISKYKHISNVSSFRNQLDKTLWYDVPFAYQPYYWDRRIQK